MEAGGTQFLGSCFFHPESLRQPFQEFPGGESVKVFDHSVVVHDAELVVGEVHRHEVVVLFLSGMAGVPCPLFGTDASGGRGSVMPVGNIGEGYLF